MTSHLLLVIVIGFFATVFSAFLVWSAFAVIQVIRAEKALEREKAKRKALREAGSRRLQALYEGRFSET